MIDATVHQKRKVIDKQAVIVLPATALLFCLFYRAGKIIVCLVVPGFVHDAGGDVLLSGTSKQGVIVFHPGEMLVAPQLYTVRLCNSCRVLPEVELNSHCKGGGKVIVNCIVLQVNPNSLNYQGQPLPFSFLGDGGSRD